MSLGCSDNSSPCFEICQDNNVFCIALGCCCRITCSVGKPSGHASGWTPGTKPALIFLVYNVELSCLFPTLPHTDAVTKAVQQP